MAHRSDHVMKKNKSLKIDTKPLELEDAVVSEENPIQMDNEAPKIEYTIGISMERIQEIFESIPISSKKEDLVLNIKKIEDVYTFLLNSAKAVNENRYNEISDKESKRVTEELEKMQKQIEKKNKLLEEEVANNIKMHNELRDKHLAEIQKIYQDSKENLLNEAILMVSKYLHINLEPEPKSSKK